MVRFLHLADIHLDTRFLGRSESLRSTLKEAQRAAFSRAVQFAINERLHFVAISGDLFDADNLSFATEKFLATEVGHLNKARIPCLYVSGNHDPGGSRSRLRSVQWPENFIPLLKSTPQTVPILDSQGKLIARVVGAGHESRFVEENLAKKFPESEGTVPYVGLLHTYVTSAQAAEVHDRYAPSTVLDLIEKRYAYWALGHIHLRQKVDDHVEAWYPGILQGRNFKESGEKGGLVVTIHDNGTTEVEFNAFSSVRWETLRLESLESVQNLTDLQQHVVQAFEAAYPTGNEDWLLRIELCGPSPLARQLSDRSEQEDLAGILAEELGACHLELKNSGLTPPFNLDRFRGEIHVLSEVLDLIDEAKTDVNLLRTLKPERLIGFEGDAEKMDSYLRELLDNLDIEAISRFVEDRHEN